MILNRNKFKISIAVLGTYIALWSFFQIFNFCILKILTILKKEFVVEFLVKIVKNFKQFLEC